MSGKQVSSFTAELIYVISSK